jgi:hypothetical protein
MHQLPDVSHLQQRAHDASCIPLPVVAFGRQLLKQLASCSSHMSRTRELYLLLMLHYAWGAWLLLK